MARVVTALKDDYLAEQTLENQPRVFACYRVIQHYAQNMSYPAFYQAWHDRTITPHPETPDNIPAGYSPTVQSLEMLIANICTQLQPTCNTHLLCIYAEVRRLGKVSR